MDYYAIRFIWLGIGFIVGILVAGWELSRAFRASKQALRDAGIIDDD